MKLQMTFLSSQHWKLKKKKLSLKKAYSYSAFSDHQLLMSSLLRTRDAPKSTPVCTMRRGMRCDVIAGSHGGRQP